MNTTLPMTVIGGYLGAGKTTLINRLLSEPHGLRLLVMVNDFGAINIDASLLANASQDTMTLTNGCVCCTMGADLFQAIGSVLDRPDRPDHLIIEASGIADPGRIAALALAEPDLSYAGVVTVVHGREWPHLVNDPQIGAQLRGQVEAADLVALSHSDLADITTPDLPSPYVLLHQLDILAPVILGSTTGKPRQPEVHGHAEFYGWSTRKSPIWDRHSLTAHLQARPKGLYRVKGFLPTAAGTWQVQVVGRQIHITPATPPCPIGLVAIGIAKQVSETETEAWWSASLSDRPSASRS